MQGLLAVTYTSKSLLENYSFAAAICQPSPPKATCREGERDIIVLPINVQMKRRWWAACYDEASLVEARRARFSGLVSEAAMLGSFSGLARYRLRLLTSPTSVAVSQRVGLNRMTRKYGINSPLRRASFYGNAIQETQWLGVLTAQMRGWGDEVKGVAMANSTDSAYAPSDSAGFYWAQLKMASHADVDHVLSRLVVTTDQGAKVYYRSPSFWRASAAVIHPELVIHITLL